MVVRRLTSIENTTYSHSRLGKDSDFAPSLVSVKLVSEPENSDRPADDCLAITCSAGIGDTEGSSSCLRSSWSNIESSSPSLVLFVPVSVRALSRATSLSHVRLKSSEALRNSARLLPIVRLSCGSLRGPKNIRAITRMKRSSVLPSESSISANTS